MKRVDEGHFLVVIHEIEDGEGFIMTAYLVNTKRKNRRYGALRSLKQF